MVAIRYNQEFYKSSSRVPESVYVTSHPHANHLFNSRARLSRLISHLTLDYLRKTLKHILVAGRCLGHAKAPVTPGLYENKTVNSVAEDGTPPENHLSRPPQVYFAFT